MIFITHDLAEALKLGDRIAIMKDGAFDQVGTAFELITEPATDYVREFTKEIPKAKVLTASVVMKPGDGSPNGKSVRLDDTIETVLPALLHDSTEIAVEDDQGNRVGVLDRDAVADALERDE
jgi:glycine betaine/proline transport system ATP-binding protein